MRQYKLRRDNWRFRLRVVSDPREAVPPVSRIPADKLCHFEPCRPGIPCPLCNPETGAARAACGAPAPLSLFNNQQLSPAPVNGVSDAL